MALWEGELWRVFAGMNPDLDLSKMKICYPSSARPVTATKPVCSTMIKTIVRRGSYKSFFKKCDRNSKLDLEKLDNNSNNLSLPPYISREVQGSPIGKQDTGQNTIRNINISSVVTVADRPSVNGRGSMPAC